MNRSGADLVLVVDFGARSSASRCWLRCRFCAGTGSGHLGGITDRPGIIHLSECGEDIAGQLQVEQLNLSVDCVGQLLVQLLLEVLLVLGESGHERDELRVVVHGGGGAGGGSGHLWMESGFFH